jgi:hypothetical protein
MGVGAGGFAAADTADRNESQNESSKQLGSTAQLIPRVSARVQPKASLAVNFNSTTS